MFVLFSIENLFGDKDNTGADGECGDGADEDLDLSDESDDLNDLMDIIDKLVLEPIAIVLEFLHDINVNVIQKSYFLC